MDWRGLPSGQLSITLGLQPLQVYEQVICLECPAEATTPSRMWTRYGYPSRQMRMQLGLQSQPVASILCGVPCWGCNPGHVVYWTGCQPRPVAIMANVTTLNNTTDFGANLAGRGVQPGLSACWVGRTPHPVLILAEITAPIREYSQYWEASINC